jgi:hypothetical protein
MDVASIAVSRLAEIRMIFMIRILADQATYPGPEHAADAPFGP